MAERLGAEIAAVSPDAEIVRLGRDGELEGEPDAIDVFCFSVDLAADAEALAAAWGILQQPSLRWVQAPGAGVELPIWSELVGRGVRLSNASGIHAEPIAQYIFTYVLHWERRVARHQQQQAEHRWEIIRSDDLTGKTLGIVGLGGIGSAAARIARAFGMRVVGLRRGPIDDANVDLALGPESLHDLLEQSDYVVLSLPLTEETRHLIDDRALAAMGPDAVLINVARGRVVDQAALERALEHRHIRGATLDVVDDEPLDPGSGLWDLDNCVITPHDAGYSPLAGERLGGLFVENLARFVGGDRLVNEIDGLPGS